MAHSEDHGAEYGVNIPREPHDQLPFEVVVTRKGWSFAPEYYPDRIPQTKDRELNRNGAQCAGESVSIKKVKNREFHVSGVLLASEVPAFNRLVDYDEKVDFITPITPSGGMECMVKRGEVDANPEGWDAMYKQWRFEYSLDFVSTGHDEGGDGRNAIVSAIIDDTPYGVSSTSDINAI